MRVALLHNTSAGNEDHTDAELRRLLRKAGHDVAHVVSSPADLAAALQREPCDLVVVAGGDGTVSRVACELAGWQVPLSIMPLGTANNTALALELPQRAKTLAQSWQDSRRMPYDLGLLDDGKLRSRFSEAVGWGAFPRTIVEAKRARARPEIAETLKRDRKLFRKIVERLEPRHYDVVSEGRDYSGEYLMVEIMNVGFLGPRLELSPASVPSDGRFELLLARVKERGALVEATKTGSLPPDSVQIELTAELQVHTDEGLLHRDGRLLRHAPGPRTFTITVEPGAVSYLL